MNSNNEPKQLYTIRYSIVPGKTEAQIAQECLEQLAEELLNVQMETEGFPEANKLIARIKAAL